MSRMTRYAIVAAVGFCLGIVDAPALVAAPVLVGTVMIAYEVTP